mmetsp:Transcript_36683/g.105717  ORF Transcript_36683/g.105717 Transcript_36683/m.105717 type:complete len:460 (-) Transcript_36683:94-1473(-)
MVWSCRPLGPASFVLQEDDHGAPPFSMPEHPVPGLAAVLPAVQVGVPLPGDPQLRAAVPGVGGGGHSLALRPVRSDQGDRQGLLAGRQGVQKRSHDLPQEVLLERRVALEGAAFPGHDVAAEREEAPPGAEGAVHVGEEGAVPGQRGVQRRGEELVRHAEVLGKTLHGCRRKRHVPSSALVVGAEQSLVARQQCPAGRPETAAAPREAAPQALNAGRGELEVPQQLALQPLRQRALQGEARPGLGPERALVASELLHYHCQSVASAGSCFCKALLLTLSPALADRCAKSSRLCAEGADLRVHRCLHQRPQGAAHHRAQCLGVQGRRRPLGTERPGDASAAEGVGHGLLRRGRPAHRQGWPLQRGDVAVQVLQRHLHVLRRLPLAGHLQQHPRLHGLGRGCGGLPLPTRQRRPGRQLRPVQGLQEPGVEGLCRGCAPPAELPELAKGLAELCKRPIPVAL